MITSWSPSITDAHMKKCDSGLEDFMDIFKPENVKEQPTKNGRNYIAGMLLDYTLPRGKGNIINRCAVVLDCDDADQAGINALCEAMRQLGVRSVVHSTYSSTPDKPRVRAVIPLKNVVVPGDYVSLCKALMNHLNMVTWDESCAQAERAMYAPAKPEGGEYWAKETEGPLMDGLEWLKAHKPKEHKTRTSKGNIAKRDHRRKPEKDTGIQGAFNRVYTIEDAIETYDLPYEPCRDGRWTYYGSHTQGGLRLVEGRPDLCISEHANTDPACFVDGNGSVRALSAFELCAVHLYGEDDDTTMAPRERASMQKMAKRAAEDENVRAELKVPVDETTDVSWLFGNLDNVDLQAQHAAEALRDRLAYAEGLGWVAYNDDLGAWECVSVSAALHWVSTVVCTWHAAAVLTGDDGFIKRVGRLRSDGSLRGILLHLEAFVTVPASKFDADVSLTCALNGVVDMRTAKPLPHAPKYHMMRRLDVRYVPGATHPAWDKALEALDPAERRWFQVWVGCALTGYQPDDHGAAVPILFGGGSNGKSVLMTAIKRAFGKYAHVGSQSLLMPKDGKAFMQAAADLRGVRLCILEEFPDAMMSGNALKQVAATPTMKGEYKYKNAFTFNTTHSLMVSTNNKLRLDECTNAVLRRLAILPFDYEYVDKLDPKEKNQRLKDVNLLRELETPEAQEAIFAWAVEGAKTYFDAGQHVLPPTPKMEAAKAEWLGMGDVLMSFFNDELIEDEDGMIPWTHLFAAFCDWQRKENGKPWNNATLKGRVSTHSVFSKFKYGKLRTTGMSLYRDEFGSGPAAPTGGRAVGLRGLRFRTPAEKEAAVVPGMYIEPEPEPEVVAPVVAEPKPEPALIPIEDIPAPIPHVVPEREEVARRELVEEVEGLVLMVYNLPGGVEEVERLIAETGATDKNAPLSKIRAFKIVLESALVRLTVKHRDELGIPFAEGSNSHRQE